jgi:hypothetical protein
MHCYFDHWRVVSVIGNDLEGSICDEIRNDPNVKAKIVLGMNLQTLDSESNEVVVGAWKALNAACWVVHAFKYGPKHGWNPRNQGSQKLYKASGGETGF